MPAISPIDTTVRIVNGIEAVKNSWPWMVYLKGVGCGASIINNNVIISKLVLKIYKTSYFFYSGF